MLTRLWLAVTGLVFPRNPQVDVPPIDAFPLPEKLYRYFPDPSRSIADASLNEDVMEWQRYEIEFMEEPRQPKDDLVPALKLKGSDQIEYECVLPQLVEAGEGDGGQGGKKKKVKRSLARWKEALEPLKKGKKVLVHRAGWWTYEFSYQKHVKQYHVLGKEEQKARPGFTKDEFLLGRFVPTSSKTELDPLGQKMIQEYIKGDICMLPGGIKGHERQVMVSFKCDSSAILDYIEDVIEISTCRYVMTIGSPRVCRLVEASKPKDGGNIRCYPSVKLDVGTRSKFHQSPSDSEHVGGPTEEDRTRHKKHQHTILRHVASNDVKFPHFSRLVNELLTEVGDLFEEVSAVDKFKVVLSGDEEEEEKGFGAETDDDSSMDESEDIAKLVGKLYAEL